jgi:DNA polymerase-3 subunit epsilon
VLDTETTGLYGASIVQIAVIDHLGRTLVDTLVNPGVPIPAEATAIHGIDDAAVAGAPTFGDVYPDLFRALHGREVIIYNRDYDTPILRVERQALHLPAFGWAQVHCAMEWYAQFCGEWSDYHKSYRWQKLWGDHSALGDCQATLRLLRGMAKGGGDGDVS